MRKKIGFFLSIIVSLSILAAPVVASPQNLIENSELISEKQIIKDNNILFERAKKGISDLHEEKIIPKAKLVNEKTQQELKVKTYTTSQLQKVTKDSSGKILQETYATTSFAIALSDGSQSDSSWDETGGVKASSTIYWNYAYNNGFTYLDMSGQKISGQWTIYDNELYLTNKKFTMGQSGITLNHGYKQQVSNSNPSSLTYNYTVPSWYPVLADGQSSIGMSAYALVNDNSGDSWGFWFSNNRY